METPTVTCTVSEARKESEDHVQEFHGYCITLQPFATRAVSTEHRISTDELSPVRLKLGLVDLLIKLSHRHSRMRRAICRLLLFILPPGRIARRMSPSTSPISIDPPGSRAIHFLDTSNGQYMYHVSTPPMSKDGPSESLSEPRTNNRDTSNVLVLRRFNTSSVSIGGPSGTRATRHLNTSNVLPVHHVSSDDERTSYVLSLQLLLTMRADRVTNNILPGDVLLLIFHFDRLAYIEGADRVLRLSWRWHRLVHVCRRWRSVVFASPNFLDLTLVCGPKTRMELTSIWPLLPIIITNKQDWFIPEDYNFDAAAVHRNRVCEISLNYLTSRQLQRLASAMQEQLPALIHLKLGCEVHYNPSTIALPDAFLDGSAPQLQSLELNSIAFPALQKLLSSATHLVHLKLWDIPHSGYFSPEAIVARLAVLVNLKSLIIGFKSPLSRPDRRSQRLPPKTRTVLPALTRFEFRGVSEYLDDFVSRIDAPLLDSIWITFFHQLIFDVPQLSQFMRRPARVGALEEAHVDFNHSDVQVGSLPPSQTFDDKSRLRISCRKADWQLSSLAQVFTSVFPSVYMVERLYIYGSQYLPSRWQDDIENIQLLEIFQLFAAVKDLYVSWNFVRCIAFALQELDEERVVDVLPALERVFLEDFQSSIRPSRPVQEAIGKFIAARQLLGHPIAVSDWNGRSLRRF